MKIYGYPKDSEVLSELDEVSIKGSPEELRVIARFLVHCADLMEKHGAEFLLIDFWATWCPSCRRSIPIFNEIHRLMGSRVTVIGLSDEPEGDIRQMRDPVTDYFVGTDTQKRTMRVLEITAIPHSILIDPFGVVVWEGNPLSSVDPLTPQSVYDILARYSSR